MEKIILIYFVVCYFNFYSLIFLYENSIETCIVNLNNVIVRIIKYFIIHNVLIKRHSENQIFRSGAYMYSSVAPIIMFI